MNCSCLKNLGCFLPNETIDFGVNAYCSGDYEFQIFGPSGVTTQIVTFNLGDPIVLPFGFNEHGETMIKIKVPRDISCPPVDGFFFVTSSDGACCFIVHGTVPVC